ncbi:hypothetical protein P0D62_00175 [Tessaracoccus sp. HF-7]|nr:hypothetical protein [Tessaracoccus caeni]
MGRLRRDPAQGLAGGRPAAGAGQLLIMPSAVADSDVILCCTSAAEPLFDGSLVRDGACVVAIGSHEPDRRELDSALMGRSRVVVEDVATALREAGDVMMAIKEGALSTSDLVAIRQVVRGDVQRAADRPNVFKTVGMSWQDLVIAKAAAEGQYP